MVFVILGVGVKNSRCRVAGGEDFGPGVWGVGFCPGVWGGLI